MSLDRVYLLTIEVKANNLTQNYANESGKNWGWGVITNYGRNIAKKLLMEHGEDVRFYEIEVTWTGGGITRDMPRPRVSITPKDVITVLGEQT